MKSFSHHFQRVPSEHDSNTYDVTRAPTNSQGSFKATPQPQSSHVPRSQFEPMLNDDNRQSAVSVSGHTLTTLRFLSHLVLSLLPIVFIVLAFLALSIDGHPFSDRGNAIYQAAKLGPSVFPIVFAAVVGRLMRTFALWKAERGSTVGLLEQLNGSQNLLAAVERAFLLPSLWGWGFSIMVLWALSPLGGQSSLRVLEISNRGTIFTQQLQYFNTDDSNNTIFIGASSYQYGIPAVQAIYQACLLAPASVSSSSTDIWNNVKIPLMQSQPGYTGSSAQDWIDIVHDNNTMYSSLNGIITSGLRSDTTSNFTMETSYFNLSCPSPVFFGNGDPSANISVLMDDFQDWLGDVFLHNNKSRIPFDYGIGEGDGSNWNSFTIDTNFNFTSPSDIPTNERPMNIIYASRNVDIEQTTAYNCSLGFTRAESMVGCNGTTCRVDKMRPSRVYKDSSIDTPWNQNSSGSTLLMFMNYFPWLSGTVHSADVTPADYYVAGNNTPFVPAGAEGSNYGNVTGLQVAQRLGALLNTAWQSSVAQSSIASPPPDLSAFHTPPDAQQPFSARSASAVMQTDQLVYRANKLWVGFTATISFILFGCGVAGMAFRYLTSAPDILGYVSTMTRDNPFFNDHRAMGADHLDGLERARLLRDAVVQISNVRPWQGHRHIALRSVAVDQPHKRSH